MRVLLTPLALVIALLVGIAVCVSAALAGRPYADPDPREKQGA